jgi:hypothetical protein
VEIAARTMRRNKKNDLLSVVGRALRSEPMAWSPMNGNESELNEKGNLS